jgi:carbon monoxide dehydrogenase subunit G
MRKVSANARVEAPAEEVFEFLADLENLPRWQTGIVSAELTTPAPIGAGSRAHVVRELMGRRLAVDLVLTAHEPGRRLELASVASGIGVTATLDLRPDDVGTRLTFTMRVKAQSLFLGPLEGIVAGAAERDIADSLERLRAHFASQAG